MFKEEIESLYSDWFDWNYIGYVIVKVTTALLHSSPKREQCDTVEELFLVMMFLSLY